MCVFGGEVVHLKVVPQEKKSVCVCVCVGGIPNYNYLLSAAN